MLNNFRVYLGNKIYFAEQLAYDMNEGMNSNTEDLTAGGIFVYSYSSATRTVEFKIKDGLNYKLKIPTDTELKNYVIITLGIQHSQIMIVQIHYQ